jgi:hypothetical protein
MQSKLALLATLFLGACASTTNGLHIRPVANTRSPNAYTCPLFAGDGRGSFYALLKFSGASSRMREASIMCNPASTVGPGPTGITRTCQDGYIEIAARNGHFSLPSSDDIYTDSTGQTFWKIYFSDEDPNSSQAEVAPIAYLTVGCIPDPTLPPVHPKMPDGILAPDSAPEI